jgi:hypothetical protein
MGIHCEYVRMTPSELDQALRDPEWADALTRFLASAAAAGDAVVLMLT